MAKSLVTSNGTVYIPGGYAAYKVQNNPGGLATTGVLFLLGEADSGPAFSAESDLETNAYGPDQLADVIAKYSGGPIVDAFRGAVAAANDPDIIGAFNRAVIVKTNSSAKAQGLLGSYATVADKSWGKAGNGIQVSVTQTQAEAPITFTFVPAVGAGVTLGFRINGGTVLSAGAITPFAAGTAVGTLPSSITLAGITGGTARPLVATGVGTLAATVSGTTLTITRSVAWVNTPSVGDSLLISDVTATLSVLAGGANANGGWYVITAATSTTITATRVVGSGTMVNVNAIAPTATDVAGFVAYASFTVTPTAVIAGAGKSLEVFASAGTPVNPYVFVGTSPVVCGSLLTSPAEQKVSVNTSRASDQISEALTAGGDIVFTIGYAGGTAATMSITDTTLTTSVTGGAGTNLSLTLSDFTNIAAMCSYISSQTGYTAAPTTGVMGLQSPVDLDTVTNLVILSSTAGLMPGRVKWDAYSLNKVVAGSTLIQFGTVANTTTAAGAGLPAVQASFYLAGGTKGGTSDLLVANAMTALEQVSGNFLVPLFSRDASLDKADGLTDASSDYTIAGINASAKSHVLAMSQFKRRKNRQALPSYQATFANQKTASANMATFRCNMPFQNPKDLNAAGSIATFQPWMAAVKAAAMQAAAGYKSITFKGIDISGVTHAAGDFDPRNDSNMEDALKAGLMPIRRQPTGGFVWVSDQTTYGKDDNFVFNSMQAVYTADTIALTVAQRMEQAFVGQSVADVSKSVALSYLESIMDDMRRRKFIAPSDDALLGYRNASIRISANAMLVSCEIKLATAIDFVAIDFLVAPVQQAT
jgi:hypothetical protein